MPHAEFYEGTRVFSHPMTGMWAEQQFKAIREIDANGVLFPFDVAWDKSSLSKVQSAYPLYIKANAWPLDSQNEHRGRICLGYFGGLPDDLILTLSSAKATEARRMIAFESHRLVFRCMGAPVTHHSRHMQPCHAPHTRPHRASATSSSSSSSSSSSPSSYSFPPLPPSIPPSVAASTAEAAAAAAAVAAAAAAAAPPQRHMRTPSLPPLTSHPQLPLPLPSISPLPRSLPPPHPSHPPSPLPLPLPPSLPPSLPSHHHPPTCPGSSVRHQTIGLVSSGWMATVTATPCT